LKIILFTFGRTFDQFNNFSAALYLWLGKTMRLPEHP